jgi:protoporphyrinogen oxidase
LSKYTILGAGLAGISASYHLGHSNCEVYEKNNFIGGHIHTEIINGFTWDEGPHVSFTKDEYVKNLFADNVEQEFLEYPVTTANYFRGVWIPHPAQSNMFAIPKELREKCLSDFLECRKTYQKEHKPLNYEEWLLAAFGNTFYNNFPKAYTQKYWTVDPSKLTTDWVGERVFYPNEDEVKAGFLAPLEKQTHYISKIRYPKKGGYFSFAKKMCQNMQVQFDKELKQISFKNKHITFLDNSEIIFENLISTIPLPVLIERSDAPLKVKEAALKLSCSSVLLINITANHQTLLEYNWMYVYDEDKYSTRINCTEMLSPDNAPSEQSGIQVEVYFSKYKKKLKDDNSIAECVIDELVEMGILSDRSKLINYHTKWVQWANVIFDFERKNALNTILDYLKDFGLERQEQDLLPMTDWASFNPSKGSIQLAGRFAEWKYYWTDDCVIKGKLIGDELLR